MGKWRRFLQLTAAERGIVFWALVFVPLTSTALRIFGYRHWQDLLFLAVPPVSSTEVRPELISEARRATSKRCVGGDRIHRRERRRRSPQGLCAV
jgi:hypothetical protein